MQAAAATAQAEAAAAAVAEATTAAQASRPTDQPPHSIERERNDGMSTRAAIMATGLVTSVELAAIKVRTFTK